MNIGQYNTLTARRLTEQGWLLDAGSAQALLPRSLAPADLQTGQRLRVFVYLDNRERAVATTRQPLALVGDFAFLEALSVTEQGAFMDWGIEKDLFVPGNLQHRPVRVGERHVTAVDLDRRTGRVVGATQLGKYFDYDLDGLEVGDEVSLLVYDFNDAGAQVVVDGRHAGIVYRDETHVQLSLGEEQTGYIRRFRNDNRLDVGLQKPGLAGRDDAQAVILQALRAAGGRLGVHDGSSPEEIGRLLGLSKKAFKRALGGLYRSGAVKLLDDGIELLQ